MLKVIRFSFTKVLNSNHVRGENTIAPVRFLYLQIVAYSSLLHIVQNLYKASAEINKRTTNLRLCSFVIFLQNLIKRHTSSYESSKPIPKPEDLPNYEVTQDENDWKYVERLLPEPYVPTVEENKIYPSGWVPQKCESIYPFKISVFLRCSVP